MSSRWQAYRRDALRDDLVAAFIVAILLIPQSLAYALLAGLPPQVGVRQPAADGGLRRSAPRASTRWGRWRWWRCSPRMPSSRWCHRHTGDRGGAGAGCRGRPDARRGRAVPPRRAGGAVSTTPVLHGFPPARRWRSRCRSCRRCWAARPAFTAPALLGSWWATGGWPCAHRRLRPGRAGAAVVVTPFRARPARTLAAAAQRVAAARCAPLAVWRLGVVLAWRCIADARGGRWWHVADLRFAAGAAAVDPALWWRLLPSAAPLALVTLRQQPGGSKTWRCAGANRSMRRVNSPAWPWPTSVAACSAGMPVAAARAARSTPRPARTRDTRRRLGGAADGAGHAVAHRAAGLAVARGAGGQHHPSP